MLVHVPVEAVVVCVVFHGIGKVRNVLQVVKLEIPEKSAADKTITRCNIQFNIYEPWHTRNKPRRGHGYGLQESAFLVVLQNPDRGFSNTFLVFRLPYIVLDLKLILACTENVTTD